MAVRGIPAGPWLDPAPLPPGTPPWNPTAIRRLDRWAAGELGLPSPVLMEQAATAVARLAGLLAPEPARILIAAGPGNNGGDGLAAHRLLAPRSRLLLVGEAGRLKGDAALQWRILEKSGIPGTEVLGEEAMAELLSNYGPQDLVVDALLGTGLDREVTGPLRRAIAAINRARARVLAVDIPSGLDGGEGRVLGAAIRADFTLTFVAPKTGMLAGDGPRLCGNVYLAQIGIPAAAIQAFLAGGA